MRYSTRNALTTYGTLVMLAATAAAQNDVYATPSGSTSPKGSPYRPFHRVDSAACRAVSWSLSNKVIISAGDYQETCVIDTPAELHADGGLVTIGITRPRTTLKVVSANLHLFGDQCVNTLPEFDDWDRARKVVPEGLAALDADVLLLQEVWDPALKDIIVADAQAYGYPYHFYGGQTMGGCSVTACLNSGLLTISKYPISDGAQYAYSDESGCDPWAEGPASKGWTQCTIMMGNFQIGLFNTHTEADAGDHEIRRNQLIELMNAVASFKNQYPLAAVVAGGDYNVAGMSSDCTQSNCDCPGSTYGSECWEYWNNLSWAADTIGGLMDAHRNAPCLYSTPASALYTSYAGNDLHHHWNAGNPSELLDYIFYSSPQPPWRHYLSPAFVMVHPLKSNQADICDHGICTDDLSDHYAVYAEFELVQYAGN